MNINGDSLTVIIQNIALQYEMDPDDVEPLKRQQPRLIATTAAGVTMTTMATYVQPQQVSSTQSTSDPAITEEIMAIRSFKNGKTLVQQMVK